MNEWQIVLMEDCTYNMVFWGQSQPVWESDSGGCSWNLDYKWLKGVSKWVSPCTIWSHLMKLIFVASSTCVRSAEANLGTCGNLSPRLDLFTRRHINEVICLAYREELHPDLTWRNHHGVVSFPADDWHYNMVTNDQYHKWLIQPGPGSIWFMQIISSSQAVVCMSR